MHCSCNLDTIREEVKDLLAIFTTFTGGWVVGWVGGWVGGVEKSRIELTSAKLGLG